MLRIQESKIGHLVDVSFASNVLGLACQPHLGSSMLRIQESRSGHSGDVVC